MINVVVNIMISIKNSKIAKSGRIHSITIPASYIRNNIVDPSIKYDVKLVPANEMEDEN